MPTPSENGSVFSNYALEKSVWNLTLLQLDARHWKPQVPFTLGCKFLLGASTDLFVFIISKQIAVTTLGHLYLYPALTQNSLMVKTMIDLYSRKGQISNYRARNKIKSN